MAVDETLSDLIVLDELALHDGDASRRGALIAVRNHIAMRSLGAKVSEAADALGVSQPTIRTWLEAGVLAPVQGTRPVRIELLALASVKRALETVRKAENDGQLLGSVRRLLRDQAILAGAKEGLAQVESGDIRPIGPDLRAEMLAISKTRSAKSLKSH